MGKKRGNSSRNPMDSFRKDQKKKDKAKNKKQRVQVRREPPLPTTLSDTSHLSRTSSSVHESLPLHAIASCSLPPLSRARLLTFLAPLVPRSLTHSFLAHRFGPFAHRIAPPSCLETHHSERINTHRAPPRILLASRPPPLLSHILLTDA